MKPDRWRIKKSIPLLVFVSGDTGNAPVTTDMVIVHSYKLELKPGTQDSFM